MALLEASGIGKNFGDTKVLKDISLTLEQGEALAIIGSSGSGKTTLLRCLNFLERPDSGVIKVNGETMWDAADPATQRESEVRKKRLHFGLVFQNFNLFPQYTALQNVMLAGELLAKERPDYKANKKAIHAELEQQRAEQSFPQLKGLSGVIFSSSSSAFCSPLLKLFFIYLSLRALRRPCRKSADRLANPPKSGSY